MLYLKILLKLSGVKCLELPMALCLLMEAKFYKWYLKVYFFFIVVLFLFQLRPAPTLISVYVMLQ